MKHFLKMVADDIRKKYKNDLSRVAVVFPNRRSGLFFNNCLIGKDEREPVWAPQYITISDLFDELSPMKKADEIKSVCLLYQIYKRQMDELKGSEDESISLDFFYGWGRQLLTDFSDIDRSMVNVRELFDSWSAARQLEQMSEEERQALEPFIRIFQSKGRLQDDFEKLWSRLYIIYKELNETLAKDGEAYEDAIQRKVIEGLQNGEIELPERFDSYAFVGFNVLLPVEWQLFNIVKETGKGLFYWDYDSMYVGREAVFSFGKKLEENMKKFPNELSVGNENIFDNLSKQTSMEFVSARSDYGQIAYMSEWLKENLKGNDAALPDEREVAVVLCDETLLQSLVHNLPDEVNEVNVTKGFPMTNTPAYAFIQQFFDEQCEETWDNQTLLEKLSEVLQKQALDVGNQQDKGSWLYQLTSESYFQCFTTVNRLHTFVAGGLLDVTRLTLQGLLNQILRALSIPFHGEPIAGVQVMGVLETRNLDFQRVILLSVNEGVLPKMTGDRSFIPYDLRKHYHIMTGDERSEVYAYNFFRLLQRPEQVTLVYNESTDGEKSQGEMSRFMRQILTETTIPVKFYKINEPAQSVFWGMENVDEERSKKLMENIRLTLSPSSASEYITCPLKFFFSHVMKLKELPELTSILQANTFGSIFHRAAELIYGDLIKQSETIQSADLSALTENELKLQEYINQAFKDVSEEELERNPKLKGMISGEMLYAVEDHEIETSVIKEYLKTLLNYDAEIAKEGGLKVLKTEENMKIVPLDEITNLTGKIDRVDVVQRDGKVVKRIVDYKTGGFNEAKKSAKSFEELFENDTHEYVMQTLCYALMYQITYNEEMVPALYFLRKLVDKDYDPYVKFGKDMSKSEKLKGFKEHLENFICKMRTSAFTGIDDKNKCMNFCPYTLLCGKDI